MAYNMNYVCSNCGKDCYGPPNSIRICPVCVENAKTEKREAHLHELRKLSLEERLYKIEEFMYEQTHKPRTNNWYRFDK